MLHKQACAEGDKEMQTKQTDQERKKGMNQGINQQRSGRLNQPNQR